MRTLDLDEAQAVAWDAIVVGTGHGGGTLGYLLAQQGWKVLFCEQGDEPRSDFVFSSRGRFKQAMVGTGLGGSSSWYGMAMQRYREWEFDASLRPEGERHHPSWPLTALDLQPYYEQVERLYRVSHGPALSPPNAELFEHLRHRPVHCSRLPLACDFVDACTECQGALCPQPCKNDVVRTCIRPAVETLAAQVLLNCRAKAFGGDGARVTHLDVLRNGAAGRLRASSFFLAAGGLHSPGVLQRSHECLEHSSSPGRKLVGRGLMRHFVDLVVVDTHARFDRELRKQLRFDLDEPPGAHVQSFGPPPTRTQLEGKIGRMLPAFCSWLGIPRHAARQVHRGLADKPILALIVEDFAREENCVVQHAAGHIEVHFSMSTDDRRRVTQARRRLRDVLAPYRTRVLKSADDNEMLAHACGTCRMGEDPATSVVDPEGRVHGIRNLYVADSSVFPTSGAVNPALTIAALAARMAARCVRP